MNQWQTVTLADVAQVFNGKTPSKIEQREEGHPVLKIKNVSELGQFRGSFDSFVENSLAKKYVQKQVKSGDILILNAAHNAEYVGSKTYRAEPITFGSLATGEWLIIRPSEELSPSYAYHWITYPTTRRRIRELVNGIHLYPKVVARLKIPAPPLSEQRRIAAILDQADALRAKRREALAQLDKLSQSIFIEMFGEPLTNPKNWTSKSLDKICQVGSSKRVFVEELVEVGIPFYRGTEIGQLGDNQAVEPSLFISREHFERLKSETGAPQKGDLLLPSICPDGRIYLVKGDKPFYFKDGRVLWIKATPLLNSVFLKQYLKQLFISNYPKIASGTTFAELKIFALKKLNILLPPLDLQNRFGNAVELIEAQRAKFLLQQSELDSLFFSLQHRAFQGEL